MQFLFKTQSLNQCFYAHCAVKVCVRFIDQKSTFSKKTLNALLISSKLISELAKKLESSDLPSQRLIFGSS